MKKFLLNKKSFAVILAMIFISSTSNVFAVLKTSAGTGVWSAPATWSPAGVPAAGDDVIIAAGHVVSVDISSASLASLIIDGTLTLGNNTTVRVLTVTGNVTVSATGIVNIENSNVTHSFLVGGNLLNNGSVDLTLDGNSLCNLTFNGAVNQSLSGTGATNDYNSLIINNTGAATNNIVEVSSTTFTVPPAFLTLTQGIFKVSGNFALSNTFFTPAGYTIPAIAGLWLNNSNATVTAQNGSPTLNGSLRISAGTYNVGTGAGNSLTYATGSTFTMEGGVLNIAARFSGTSAAQTTTFNMSGGTLTTITASTSSALSSFDISASGSSFTMSGGTIVIEESNAGAGGDYRNVATTTSITGGSLQFGNANTGAAALDDFDIILAGPHTLPSLSIVDNATSVPTLTLAAGITVKGNVTVNTGTSLLAAGQSITVSGNSVGAPGNWTNSGTFTSGTQTTTFNGTALQTITGAAIFSGLTIDNTAGVSLATNVTVNGAATLNNGLLNILAGNTLTIVNGNVIGGTGFGSAKHINTEETGANTGVLRVNNMAAAPYTFPVGDGTNYLPVSLTPSDAPANNTFSVSAFNGITTDGTPNGTPFSAAQKAKVVDAVWTINYNGPGTPTAAATNMVLGWPSTLEGAAFSANANPLIGIAHFDGPLWGTAVGSGDNVANTATRNAITTFSPFAVGTINAGGAPLAIKVNYFNAAKGNGVNTLNWAAACSSTEATFEIERSSDGVSFTTINSITATQARCAQPFSYDDNSNVSAIAYYRIKAIDYNGKISYTLIIKVGSQVKDMRLAGLLPNPVSNTAQLSITTVKKDKVELSIVSLEGKVVYRNTVQLQNGTSIVNLEISNLSKGTYVVRGVFSDGQTNSIKFVKQ